MNVVHFVAQESTLARTMVEKDCLVALVVSLAWRPQWTPLWFPLMQEMRDNAVKGLWYL